jgi:hypothetical protein
MATTRPYTPPGFVPRQQQLYQQAPPAPSPDWAPWNGTGWDQQSLANSFSTMALQPPHNSVNDWVADSGTSHHTTSSVGNISNPRPLNSASPSSIIVGNGSTLQVISVGDSVIPGLFYLNNILLAPDIIQSLLSVHRFTTDNWCSMEFDPFDLSVKDLTTRNVIARSNSIGPLYTLRLPSSTASSRTSSCAMSAIDAPRILAAVATSTWHHRLGHPGHDALSSVSRSSFISYTSTTHDFCHACQLGKHTKLPFFSSSSRAEKVFNLLHLDLWISPVVSVSGSKYYLVILDDFTHYLWTFPLKQKSDTFTTLSNFFAYVATQFSCTVKDIQCDNGREFDNSSTQTFLLSKGAQLRMSCPYTSPQNGKVECIICTINNVIRMLVIQASLPRCYWAEGLHTVVYQLNRLLTKMISDAFPHVALFGSAPSYEYLCVFGCACYPNIAVTAHHKLNPQSTRCVFLGYSTNHKCYSFLDLSTTRLIVSHHVVFDEESFSLTASPNLTDLDFLCESGSPVSTIGTPISLAASSTAPACQHAPIVPSEFEPHTAPMLVPLPAPQVPPGFPPCAAPASSAP